MPNLTLLTTLTVRFEANTLLPTVRIKFHMKHVPSIQVPLERIILIDIWIVTLLIHLEILNCVLKRQISIPHESLVILRIAFQVLSRT